MHKTIFCDRHHVLHNHLCVLQLPAFNNLTAYEHSSTIEKHPIHSHVAIITYSRLCLTSSFSVLNTDYATSPQKPPYGNPWESLKIFHQLHVTSESNQLNCPKHLHMYHEMIIYESKTKISHPMTTVNNCIK